MPTDEITKMEEGGLKPERESGFCGSPEVVQVIQKVNEYMYETRSLILNIYFSLILFSFYIVVLLS